MNKPPDKPNTLEEWLWYVIRYEDGIYVREQQPDGKWDSVALSSLSSERWAFHVSRWLENGVLPVRVREDDEINNGAGAVQTSGPESPDTAPG